MVAAGVSLIRALNIVTEQIGNVKLRNAVRDCMQQVEAGSSFSEAMDNNPDHLFSAHYDQHGAGRRNPAASLTNP